MNKLKKDFFAGAKVALFVILLTLVSFSPRSQEPVIAELSVAPDMIQISYDGIIFTDASLLVSEITISEGIASGPHITHVRRGDVINWEGQLGTPYAQMKVTWKLDTGQIPKPNHKFYVRVRWAVTYTLSDLTTRTTTSPWSDSSDDVKLIGKPDKAKNTG